MQNTSHRWKIITFLILFCTSAPLSAGVLTGSGTHLPIPVPNPGNPDRVAPVYVDGAGTFTGTWSLPAQIDWHGDFAGTGLRPGTSGPGPASIDYTTLNNGSLPVGSIFGLGDLDAGSGPSELITLVAFDGSMNPLSEWLDEPFAVGSAGSATDTPAWNWDSTTNTYTFDGSVVPGNPSVVVLMRSNQEVHFLEVFRESIGFGYAIDAPPVEDTTIFGLPHRPLGEAKLTEDGTGHLVVSNLGSSGEDGVSIDLGAAEFQLIRFEPAEGAPSLPDGAAMTITTNGELNGEPDRFIWSLQVEDVGDEFGLSLNSEAVQPGSVRVEARLDGEIVDSVVFDPAPAAGEILVTFQPEGCVVDPFWAMVPECWAIVELAGSQPVTITGSQTVLADSIVVASVDQLGRVGSLSATQMQTTGIPEFTIFEESLGMFDLPHQALGVATLTAEGNRLTVSNLGSSGMDGVSIDVGETLVWRSAVSDFAQAGGTIDYLAIATIDGVPDQPAAGISLRENKDLTTTLVADFPVNGGDPLAIQVFSNDELVGEEVVSQGAVARIACFIDGLPVPCSLVFALLRSDFYTLQLALVQGEGGGSQCVWAVDMGENVTITVNDMELEGDRVTVSTIPTGTGANVAFTSQIQITSAGTDAFSIVSQSLESPVENSHIFRDGFESGDTSAWSVTNPLVQP